MERYGLAALGDVEGTGRTLALGVGDVLVVVAVLTAGMLRHGVDPMTERTHAVAVIAPFLVGWLLAAPILGAYARTTLSSTRATVWAGAVAWLVATLVGVSFRATPAFPGTVTGLFAFVMIGFGLLGIVAWRLAFALFAPATASSVGRPNLDE